MKTENIYDVNGYLNVPKIKKLADHADISFIVVIGSRQVGKTYGTLKLMLDKGEPFILMRRTQAEVDFILHSALNPFSAIDSSITCKRASRYHGDIIRRGATSDTDENVGIVLALTTISKIRGFSGAAFTDLVFDEFIPERHVMRFRGEGDAFLNAIVTISGNRELDDKKPLRVWLLANANNLQSPILSALNLTAKVESMQKKGQELSVMPERGVLLMLPQSKQLMEKRKKTALTKVISDKSEFSRMAFDNKFSYNDDTGVQPVRLSEYRFLCTVPDRFSVYIHKSSDVLAVTDPVNMQPSCRNLNQFSRLLPWARAAFLADQIIFSSLRVRSIFEEFII